MIVYHITPTTNIPSIQREWGFNNRKTFFSYSLYDIIVYLRYALHERDYVSHTILKIDLSEVVEYLEIFDDPHPSVIAAYWFYGKVVNPVILDQVNMDIILDKAQVIFLPLDEATKKLIELVECQFNIRKK